MNLSNKQIGTLQTLVDEALSQAIWEDCERDEEIYNDLYKQLQNFVIPNNMHETLQVLVDNAKQKVILEGIDDYGDPTPKLDREKIAFYNDLYIQLQMIKEATKEELI
jgi:hypothetical protein